MFFEKSRLSIGNYKSFFNCVPCSFEDLSSLKNKKAFGMKLRNKSKVNKENEKHVISELGRQEKSGILFTLFLVRKAWLGFILRWHLIVLKVNWYDSNELTTVFYTWATRKEGLGIINFSSKIKDNGEYEILILIEPT